MKNGIDLSSKTILLVNAGTIKKRFILQRLNKLGIKIICLNKEKNWAAPYSDHWILADNTNYTEAVSAVRDFITNNPEIKINGAITFWEDDVLLTAKIIDKFNFIGTPLLVAKKIRNKYQFRHFCQENGLPTPRYTLIKSIEDIEKLETVCSYPVVIKPTFGAGSAYVVKSETKEELVNTYKYIKQNISTKIESALNDGLDLFVEEYIPGDEVDIDIVLQNGKIKFHSISDNYQTKEPFFLETGFSIPSSLSNKIQQDLIAMADEVLEKLGVQNGVIHFEAKSTPTGPVPIEINLRLGGDEVYSFVKEAWDVDLIECAVKIAVGSYIPKIEKEETPKKYLTGIDFLSDNSGVISKLDINEEIRSKKYLDELHIFKKVGDPILVPPEGYEYLGWITVSGFSLPDAQENLKDAFKYIDYEVSKFTANSYIGKTSRKDRFSHASLNSQFLVQAAKIERIKKTTKGDQSQLHIGLVGNYYEDAETPQEKELNSIVTNIEQTLKKENYKVTFFNFNDFEKNLKEIKNSDIDLIFNVCKRLNNYNSFEPTAAALLETLQIPYTGSDMATLALCQDKIKMKKLLNYHNIPTPKWDYAYDIDDGIDPDLQYPLIVKPANTNNCFGIDNSSVVNTPEELARQLNYIINEVGSPALIEEYIDGEEYDVSIIGNEWENLKVLPLSRSIFKDMPQGQSHIHTYETKSALDQINRQGIIVERPSKNTNKKLETLITEIALDTYDILDCHDYGVINIRVDKYDNPYVLELNPNPPIGPTDCLPDVAQLSGMDYNKLLEEIISTTIARYKDKKISYNISY